MDDDFLLELLTYTCPHTGKKRCAAQASLQVEKPLQSKNLCWIVSEAFRFRINILYKNCFMKHLLLTGYRNFTRARACNFQGKTIRPPCRQSLQQALQSADCSRKMIHVWVKHACTACDFVHCFPQYTTHSCASSAWPNLSFCKTRFPYKDTEHKEVQCLLHAVPKIIFRASVGRPTALLHLQAHPRKPPCNMWQNFGACQTASHFVPRTNWNQPMCFQNWGHIIPSPKVPGVLGKEFYNDVDHLYERGFEFWFIC